MLYIFRGDDIAFSEYDRRICIRLDTFKDLTGWSAKFNLVDNEKVFPDISSRLITFGYTSDETAAFPLGKTYGKLTIFDEKGQIKQMVQVDVEVCNKTSEQGVGGTISVSIDNVLSDYNNLGNKPTINGKKVEGNHDGHYYNLAHLEDFNGMAETIAIHSEKIEGLQQTVQTSAATIADQGVAIAQNHQEIQCVKIEQERLTDEVKTLKEKTKDVDEAICRAVRREETARKEEDLSLSNRIDTEVSERSAAVRAVRADLEAEKTARSIETTQLSQKLTAEIANRESEGNGLRDAIEAEAQKRSSGDKLNADRIDSISDQLGKRIDIVAGNLADARTDFAADLARESEFREKSDKALDDKIKDLSTKTASQVDAETKDRKESDEAIVEKTKHGFAVLKGRLDAEVHAREFTDSSLTAEAIKREKGDNDLTAKITAEAKTRSDGDAEVLKQAKEYTDQFAEKALHFKGTKEFFRELLEIEDQKIGDMWNVEKKDDGTPLGANFAWDGTKWDKLSETIDLRPFLKKEEFEVYHESLRAADAANATAIATETENRQKAVNDEASAREAKDRELSEGLAQETTDRTNEDSAIRDLITAKVNELKAADTLLDSNIKAISGPGGLLDVERTARIEGDAATKHYTDDAIALEADARQKADADINTTITAKVDELKAADALLNSKIEAISGIGGLLEVERAARIEGDAATKRYADDAIGIESDSRQQADAALGTRIDNVYEKIELERQQSVQRDNDLTSRIAAEETKRAADDAKNLEEAKAYADTVGAKAMHFKGSVATVAELETKSATAQQGDMWNVEETGANYAWTGLRWDKLSETIDLTPFAKKTDVAADKAELEGKIQENAGAIEVIDEKADAISLVANSAKATAEAATADLAQEVLRSKGADQAHDTAISNLRTAIEDEVSRSKAADTEHGNRINTLETAIENEATARGNEDARVLAEAKKYCDDKERGIETRVDELAQTVSSQAETIAFWSEKIDANTRDIRAEQERATAAEQVLTDNLAQEVSDRTAADETLQGNIDAEATTARAAEQKLTEDLTTEASTARAAEQANAEAIAAEVTRSTNKDTELSQAITDEATTARAAELANANAISAEATTARAAEQANADAISAEATTARAAEEANAAAISAETTERTNAISNLTNGTTLFSQIAFSSPDKPGKTYRLKVRIVDNEPTLEVVEV